MKKDDHLIYESLVQSRAPMSDEQAAKMITDKIKGTPNLNIQNIKMYVQRYMGLTGKAPSDVDFIAAMVHDNLQNMGMGENAEGMSDAEYHKARKDAFEGAGEELGHGPIKLQLMRDQKFDCYKSGTVQEVEFVKGTIFNCEDAQSDYYHCETEEYGTIAVFPEGMKRLSGEEDAESADEKKELTQRKWEMNKNRWAKWKMENPEAAAKHAAKKAGKSENAEVSSAFHYDPMPGLMKAANEIRDILHGAANDEARTEHIIKMAQTILGDPTEYDKNEYRKILDGLIVLLNRFIVVPMN